MIGMTTIIIHHRPSATRRERILVNIECCGAACGTTKETASVLPSATLTILRALATISVFVVPVAQHPRKRPHLSAASEAFRKSKARAGLGAYIDQSILDLERSADYEQIALSRCPWQKNCAAVPPHASQHHGNQPAYVPCFLALISTFRIGSFHRLNY